MYVALLRCPFDSAAAGNILLWTSLYAAHMESLLSRQLGGNCFNETWKLSDAAIAASIGIWLEISTTRECKGLGVAVLDFFQPGLVTRHLTFVLSSKALSPARAVDFQVRAPEHLGSLLHPSCPPWTPRQSAKRKVMIQLSTQSQRTGKREVDMAGASV